MRVMCLRDPFEVTQDKLRAAISESLAHNLEIATSLRDSQRPISTISRQHMGRANRDAIG